MCVYHSQGYVTNRTLELAFLHVLPLGLQVDVCVYTTARGP